ncbi:putative glycosyltransferase [Candidatus Terasakiella magnetica]|uniref:Putative glycosyltransferase n=1 Tax=Candidatus Terasakiella magnetica TaxID=1867952 RepID=A0A1C3RHZ3_9PROT|nr:glycosyltransferase [Candidatus Terasakiella magnetica]SCA56897.1 putative glycosyltransferase [Candidatus Terasakiella magnetica]
MRILQTMAGAEFGGAEAFFTRLAVALQKTDVEQRVIIRENPARARALRAGQVEPLQLSFGGALDVRTGMTLRREIKNFNPDVVLTWMNRATKKTPAGKGKFVKVARLGGYYDLKYYRDCDHLVGNTQDIVDYLVKEGWPAERAHYLPNFVTATRAEPASRMELSTPEDAPLLLSLGRLHENKAFDTLLKALARVPGVYLWLAGEGPLRRELELQAEELGIRPRVRFLGWREDTASLFAASDVYICPSRHEPLGNVVLEGWAQGRPVIAADSLGPGTLIEHGENGVLCPVDNDKAMGDAIKWVFSDQDFAYKLATRGWESYQRDFTEEVVVQKYLEFFEKITQDVA